MRKGFQNMCYALGAAGCYALCLVDVAEEQTGRHVDVLDSIERAIDKGYITYDWENWSSAENFYVNYPALFLELMTGKKWEVTKGLAGRVAGEREYIIRRYELTQTGRTLSHFERDSFKPYANSRTVRFGAEASVRVCKVLN